MTIEVEINKTKIVIPRFKKKEMNTLVLNKRCAPIYFTRLVEGKNPSVSYKSTVLYWGRDYGEAESGRVVGASHPPFSLRPRGMGIRPWRAVMTSGPS